MGALGDPLCDRVCHSEIGRRDSHEKMDGCFAHSRSGGHTGSCTKTHRADRTGEALHHIVQGQAAVDVPARGVDDELNRLMVDGVEIKQLRDNLFGGLVIDWLRQEDGALRK